MSRPSPTSTAARRGRPGYDQEAVLRRAIDLFNRRGYDGTSVGDLARELGLTKSAIYHHFPSKSHLLQAALDEALDALTAVIDAAARAERGGGTAYARLEEAVRGSVVVLVEHLPAVTLLLRVRGNSEVEQEALRRRRRIDAALAGLVRAAAEEGALRTDIPPDLATRLLFGMVNSLVEWYRPEGRYDAAAIAEAVTTLAFDGLAPREA
ncbi:TetR/AcrR family transcriptional regulator [Streptomonospora nanhaiensis]|uniref:AcrR family transcriptional regulator n=1 Tax=Streptomonospora nanhaiensis TaxID=1323731 RepID=A0A853BJP1_9ACTN|nr:TetR/AcrR family transcriptional regulator [Streptomonospora nanhaiensis]MBV2365873.1 TetR/AcrR family transcriptional regulator [Streptomonospora nanhaiensis]MBX9387606.1 TetR/AcrR family transcriptional regulator [Streptomonospora nanhaiensis]NYI95250.1 AcrR family transcriptional regulator [Streptomonospora nanhaiensis]